MYESPITLIKSAQDNFVTEVNKKTDEVIFKAVVNVLPQVNKEELIKALEYDRGQYVKGYQDRDAEIVRCKDCKNGEVNEEHPNKPIICYLTKMCGTTKPDWFCADGERREESEVEE